MKVNNQFLQDYLESVDSSDVKECLELCLDSPNLALDTIALARFSKSFDRFSKASSETYIRNPLIDHEFYLETLKEKVRSSGVYYFGPMFQIDERSQGLVRTRSDILKSLKTGGFSTEILRPMSDEILDMYFCHLLETGLVSNISR